MKSYNKVMVGAIAFAMGASAFTACTDKIAFGNALLDKPSGSSVTADTVFNSPIYTEQFLNSIYALQYYGLPYNNKNGNSASPWTGKLDQVTDCWVMHWDNNTIYKAYYPGTLDATQNPLIAFTGDNVWEAVHAAYLLLEHLDNVPGMSDAKKASLKAQAQCLIAARYFDLFIMYGGLPLVDHAFTGLEGTYEQPRGTVEETVNYMVNLLDQAINSGALPWMYNGTTTETDATNNTGRWTKAGAMALKAKILTFAASPLFNSDQAYYGGTTEAEQQHLVWYGDFQQSRWETAKKACKDFFDELAKNPGSYALVTAKSLGLNNTCDGYRQAYRMGYAQQGSTEILHSVRVGGVDAYKSGTYVWHQYLDNPARLNCLPTQEYIEMFPWSDGTPFDWKTDSLKGRLTGKNGRMFYQYKAVPGGFAKTASRDPRLYEECIVNGQMTSLSWDAGKSTGDVYELWVGGQHAGTHVAQWDEKKNELVKTEALAQRYATGYDCNKYYMNQDYLRKYTQWVYLSLDEMYLMYAECLAQTGDLAGAVSQVDVVRSRVGLKSISKAVSAVKTDKETMLNEILRERACELGISNNHYYDMVRYKRGDWMTKPLHGIMTFRMQQNDQGKWVRVYRAWMGADKNSGEAEPSRFEYEKFEISNRKHVLWGKDPNSQEVAKWFLSPFPQKEINKAYGLVQNPGW